MSNGHRDTPEERSPYRPDEPGRTLSPDEPCPVCGPVGHVRLDPDGSLSCSNCLWDAPGRTPSRSPRLLDLFSGAGGCSEGYRRAGFDVTGVDIDPHPDYPFEFICDDALNVLGDVDFLDTFDAIHASPPCPRYSTITRDKDRDKHPDLVEPVRAYLSAWAGPYVIENVMGAPLVTPAMLCGASFGLGAMCKDGIWRPLARHRLFETNVAILVPPCRCDDRQSIGVYGHGGGKASKHGYSANAAEAREAMGIGWMKHYDVVQAIPPVYTEYIGAQLLAAIKAAEAAA